GGEVRERPGHDDVGPRPWGVCLTLSRFSAPRVASRSRSGRATADWKPTLRAAVENGGQRADPARRFSCSTGWPTRKASRQGPSWAYSSNSSSRRIASLVLGLATGGGIIGGLSAPSG